MAQAHGVDDVVVGAPHRLGGVEVEPHAAGFGLARELRRVDLQGHRKAGLLGDEERLGGVAGDGGVGDRDAEAAQQRLGLHCRQDVAALVEQGLDQHARATRAAIRGGAAAGGLQQQGLAVVEARDVVEQLDRRLGRAEHRQPGLGEQRARLRDLAAAHPAAANIWKRYSMRA